MEPIFRPETLDKNIWREVYHLNEYKLPSEMNGQIVIDIGMHIGAFSAACKHRNVFEIFGVEMLQENLWLAIENVSRETGKAVLQSFHAAAWRSDRRGDRLHSGGHDGKNTGGAWSLPNDGILPDVPSIPFDDLVKLASDYFRRRIDLVKLDCEGAEWPILFTSKTLHIIDKICGEYHAGCFDSFLPAQKVEGVTYTIESLRMLLLDAGFAVEIEEPNHQKFAHFWAYRCV